MPESGGRTTSVAEVGGRTKAAEVVGGMTSRVQQASTATSESESEGAVTANAPQRVKMTSVDQAGWETETRMVLWIGLVGPPGSRIGPGAGDSPEQGK